MKECIQNDTISNTSPPNPLNPADGGVKGELTPLDTYYSSSCSFFISGVNRIYSKSWSPV